MTALTRFLVAAATAGVTTAAVAGCESSTDPRTGGTAVVAYVGAPRAANPLIASDTYSDAMNRFLLFLPLLRFDHELRPTPGLARRWSMEGDSAAVFELHRSARWTDGQPTTAEDVAFTLARALDPETGHPNRGQIAHIRDVEVVDSYTVRLRFDRVREPLAMLASLAIVPRHALDTVQAEALSSAAFNLRPVTNGPFRVVEARPGDRWVFAADTLYPEELGGRPRLDRLVWRAIPESSAMATELQAGEVDVAVGVRADVYDRLSDTDGYQGTQRPTLEYTAVAWNGRRPPLDDAGVRRALALATDRRQILEGSGAGTGPWPTAPSPPATGPTLRRWSRRPTMSTVPGRCWRSGGSGTGTALGSSKTPPASSSESGCSSRRGAISIATWRRSSSRTCGKWAWGSSCGSRNSRR